MQALSQTELRPQIPEAKPLLQNQGRPRTKFNISKSLWSYKEGQYIIGPVVCQSTALSDGRRLGTIVPVRVAQLTTGRGHVPPARRADRGVNAGVFQAIAEPDHLL